MATHGITLVDVLPKGGDPEVDLPTEGVRGLLQDLMEDSAQIGTERDE